MAETRKLAAILVSDIVGYSRLARADEDRILARLRTLRSDLIDPTIAVHHGRIVKRTGDGGIIEFRSVVVAENDGDLMGDGVNIAARLQGVAKPGAICLSEDAYRQVKGRLDLKVSDLGPTELKNIAEPIRVYSLEVGQLPQAGTTPAASATIKPGRAGAPKASGFSSRWPALAAALAPALLAAGAYAWHAGYAPWLPGASVA